MVLVELIYGRFDEWPLSRSRASLPARCGVDKESDEVAD